MAPTFPGRHPFLLGFFGLRYDWTDLGREAWGAVLGPTCGTQTRQSNPETLTLDPKASCWSPSSRPEVSEKQPTTRPKKRFRNPFPGRGLLSADKELGSRTRPRPQTPAQYPKNPKKSQKSLVEDARTRRSANTAEPAFSLTTSAEAPKTRTEELQPAEGAKIARDLLVPVEFHFLQLPGHRSWKTAGIPPKKAPHTTVPRTAESRKGPKGTPAREKPPIRICALRGFRSSGVCCCRV